MYIVIKYLMKEKKEVIVDLYIILRIKGYSVVI